MNEELMATTESVESVEEGNKDWMGQAMPAHESVENQSESLLGSAEANDLQSRWDSLQIKFVDEPHASVEQADALVAEAVEKISRVLTDKRSALDEQWVNRENISTEDLRIALQSYRSFFKHLLTL